MNRRIGRFPGWLVMLAGLGISGLCFWGLTLAQMEPGKSKVGPVSAKPQMGAFGDKLPLYFIENRGQADPRVKFYQRGAGETIFFTREGVGFSLRRGEAKAGIAGSPARPGSEQFLAKKRQAPAAHQPAPALVQLTPVGMQPQVEIAPAAPQAARFNYFIGNDPKKWRTDVPSYGAVVYREAYPGIDLKFYGAARQLEYDIIVKPGADPDLVKFHYAGIKSLAVTPAGDLALKLPGGGELLQKKPVVYQEIAGRRVAREGKFRVGPDTACHVYGFEVASYDKTAPLIIDPVLVYSTYLGGGGDDEGYAIAVDGQGCAYVTGLVWSPNLGTAGAYQPSLSSSSSDAFVAKFNAAGSALVFFTYLGGSNGDSGQGIAVGGDGSIYVTGLAASSDFPLYNALPANGTQNQKLGPYTAFVTQLTASGDGLVYSTFLGGSDKDFGEAIAVDSAGNAYITGATYSSDFPLSSNPYHAILGGPQDAFVTKLSPNKIHVISLDPLIIAFHPDILISTYFGGDGYDFARAIALDNNGNIYIAGSANSTNFPTQLAYSAHKNMNDPFVACFDATGALFFSTCLGGAGSDMASGLALDRQGNIYVTGDTSSSDFPVQNPFQGSLNGLMNAFVTKLYPPVYVPPHPPLPGFWLPVSLAYSTYLGGDGYSNGYGIVVDPQGCAYVVGATTSTEFPTRRPYQAQNNGDWDVFVAKLAADGQSLVYSTLLGGAGTDSGYGIALGADGNAYVAGSCGDVFPTRNPLQANFGGDRDAFVAKLSQPAILPYLLLLGD
jgi:Beta-propeller repeat